MTRLPPYHSLDVAAQHVPQNSTGAGSSLPSFSVPVDKMDQISSSQFKVEVATGGMLWSGKRWQRLSKIWGCSEDMVEYFFFLFVPVRFFFCVRVFQHLFRVRDTHEKQKYSICDSLHASKQRYAHELLKW